MDPKKRKQNQNRKVQRTRTCDHTKTTVEKTTTIIFDDTTVIRRIRKCCACGVKFRTREERMD